MCVVGGRVTDAKASVDNGAILANFLEGRTAWKGKCDWKASLYNPQIGEEMTGNLCEKFFHSINPGAAPIETDVGTP